MKTDTLLNEVEALFPEAFEVPLRFSSVLGRDDDGVKCAICLLSHRWYPLEGVDFESGQDERNALWLLNWMSWVQRCGMDADFRAPLVVIDGPPMSGKTTLLEWLAAIAEVPLAHALEVAAPRSAKWLQAPILVHDNISVGELGTSQFELLGMLVARSWRGRHLRNSDHQTIPLRFLTVMTGCGLELPPELHRRAMFIRLKAADFRKLAGDVVMAGGSLELTGDRARRTRIV